MHRRTFPAPSELLFVPTPSDVGTAPTWSSAESGVSKPLTTLTQQLGSLESQVAMLQHQVALLTEQLQKEFQWRTNMVKGLRNLPWTVCGIFPRYICGTFPGDNDNSCID